MPTNVGNTAGLKILALACGFGVGTVLLDAVCVQIKGVIIDSESSLMRDAPLSMLDLRVVELFHAATLQADQMIVMTAFVEFKNRLAGIEMVALQQTGLLELRQYAIHGGQADIHILGQQQAIDIFGGHVAVAAR